MILKYCFKDEIHKSFIAPPTFISLLKEVTTIFGDKLPSNFNLQYRDNDGDFVTISSDIEYLSMLKFDLPKVREMVRIFIIPSHQSQMMEEADVKPVDLSLSSKKSSDGSFEVIEENSQNTSGNISEFSLDSAKKSSKSPSKSNSEAALSPKAVQDFNFNEENSSDSSVDFNESIHSHNDTIHKIEARVEAHRTPPLTMRQNNAGDLMDDDDEDDEKTLPMAQNNAGDLVDDEDSLPEDDYEMRRIEQLQTSIDRILNFIQPADNTAYGNNNNGKASPTQYYSLDNSVLSKEINQAAEELAAIRIRRIINRLKNLQPPSDKDDSSPSFAESADSAEEQEESIDLRDIKPLTYTEMGLERRARIMSAVSAAIIIQKAYRSYRINKLIKVFRDFEASYPLEQVTMKDQGTQMIPLEYQYEFSPSKTISEASSFSIKTPCEPKEEETEEWNLQRIQPKDYRVSFEENSYEEDRRESPMKKCYHCEDFEFCEHYHSGYKTFNDSHMRMMAHQNYKFKAPSKFNYIPSPILKGRYDSYFMSNQVTEQPMIREADKSLNYRLLPGMSNTPVFLSSIDGKKIAYKTVYLINTGSRPWRKCYVKAMGPLSGRTAEIYNVDVGQIALATIELYGHYGADSYKSQWKVIHENENGMMEPVGEPFEVDITFEVKENMIDEEIMREIRDQGVEDEGRQIQEQEEEEDEMQENKSMSLSMEERRLDEFRAKYIYQNSQNYEEEEQDCYQDSMGLSVEQRNVHQTEEDDEEEEEEEEEEYEEDYEDEEEEEEDEEEENSEEEEQDNQQQIDEENMPFANYQKYLEEIAKVKEIGRHFPCDPWDEIFDFVLERAYMSIEQIYEEYVSYRNAV